MSRAVHWLCLIGIGIAATACSSNDQTADTSTTSVVEDENSTPARATDGVLTLGLLVPNQVLDPDQRRNFESLTRSMTVAIDSVSSPSGMPVRLVVREETGNTQTDRATLDDMIEADEVDALIGPFSTSAAVSLVPVAVEASLGVCSSAASGIDLDDLPDSGLFIRTRPTERTVLEGVAQLTKASGYNLATVLYPDDVYGRRAMETLRAQFAERGINDPSNTANETSEQWEFPYTMDADGELRTDFVGTDSIARVIVLIASESATVPLLAAADESLVVLNVIMNDGFADARLPESAFDSRLTLGKTKLWGSAVDHVAGWTTLMNDPITAASNLPPDLEPIPFLTGVADCLNVMALSAIRAKSDLAEKFMPVAESTANSGTPCATIQQCLQYLGEGRDIDYQGSTGNLSLDANGDAQVNSLLRFEFGPDRRTVATGVFELD